MQPLEHERVKEVFLEACLRPRATRARFVAATCADSPALRREVQSLLAFHEATDATSPSGRRRATSRNPHFRRGRVLAGRFRIERLLGRGGMGEVYAAFDRVLGASVALKTLRVSDEGSRARLYEEVRLTRTISHPAVCRVHDVGEHDGVPFLTMELIDGEDLAARLARSGPLPSGAVAALGARLCGALAAAHDVGIVHRDIKPRNVLIDSHGSPHVTDFGIAVLRRPPASGTGGDPAPESLYGTPAYMAPELSRPGESDEKVDLYSLGVVLYELLTGRPPFDATDPTVLEEMHRSIPPLPPSHATPSVDRRLEAWILRLLAKPPAARPSSAHEVADALASLRDEDLPDRRVVPSPEHRPLVALLYRLDVTGAHEAADVPELLERFVTRCAAVCVEHGGRIERRVERGLLVYFGYPQASDRDAERAVDAGLEILDEVESRSANLECTIRAAVAVHASTALFTKGRSGSVTVSAAVGHLGLLRRILEPGTVVVSAATLPLLRDGVVSNTLDVTVGAAGQPARARFIVRRPVRRGPGIEVLQNTAPLVGRELELAQLLRHWERAREGNGQVVLVTGEAGMGKTRLLHELWSRISIEARGLEIHCRDFHRSSPLAPFLDLVRRAAGIEHDDDAARRVKLGVLLEPLGPRAAAITDEFVAWLAPAVAANVDRALSSSIDSRSFVRGAVDWILALATAQPLMVVVDDLQWSDPTSLEALDLLAQECEDARLLLLLSFRPELTRRFRTPRPGTVVLHPLRPGEARVLAAAAAGTALTEPALDTLVASANGNPLFVEELAREARAARSSGSISAADVPLTLMGLLQSRMDRLGAANGVAQAAAVLGRSFGHQLLAAMVAAEPDLDLEQSLDRLRDENLLHRRGTSPNATYTFRQPLLRQAVNAAMPEQRKRVLHARVAELLPAVDPASTSDRPEEVASHWMIAGLPAKAHPWWRQGGLRALERSAFAEAVDFLEQAVRTFRTWARDTATESPEMELELLVALMSAHSGLNLLASDLGSIVRRMSSLCKRVDAGPALVLAHVSLVRYKVMSQDTRGLFPLIRRTEELANETGDPRVIATVWSQAGVVHALYGRYAEAEAYCERCLASDARKAVPGLAPVAVDHRVIAAYARSLCNWARGRTRALRLGAAQASRDADDSGHLHSRAFGRVLQGVPLLLSSDYDAASRSVRDGLALAAQVGGLAAVEATGHLLETLIDSARGTAPPERAEHALSVWEASGRSHFAEVGRLVVASALDREGQEARALAVVEEGCARSAGRLSRFAVPELHRSRGDLLARAGRPEEAAAALRLALRLAQKDGAHALVLRAAISLAGLLAAGGATRDATQVLEQALARLDDEVDADERGHAESLLEELGAGRRVAAQ